MKQVLYLSIGILLIITSFVPKEEIKANKDQLETKQSKVLPNGVMPPIPINPPPGG